MLMTIIVMTLSGQLFGAQFIGGGDFGSQIAGTGETVRVE